MGEGEGRGEGGLLYYAFMGEAKPSMGELAGASSVREWIRKEKANLSLKVHYCPQELSIAHSYI